MSGRQLASADRPRKITNLSQYIFLLQVRSQTGLIAGNIVYDGKSYSQDEYDREFPAPVLEYEDRVLDSRLGK